MGIDGIQGKRDEIQVERQGRPTTAGRQSTSTSASSGEDSVELSSSTTEFLRLRKLVDSAPDTRQDRVDQLRQQISEGTYNVPASDIAKAILDEWI